MIFGEMHLRRILTAYAAYYNQARTHLALQKDAPSHRAVQPSGAIVAIPILADCTTDTFGYDFRKGYPSERHICFKCDIFFQTAADCGTIQDQRSL